MTTSVAITPPVRSGRRWRRIRRAAALAFALCLLLAAALGAWTISLGPLSLDDAKQVSTTVVDRHGKLLRAFAMRDGRWRLPVDAKTDVDPGYVALLLAYEDQRFRSHIGVDPCRRVARPACGPSRS